MKEYETRFITIDEAFRRVVYIKKSRNAIHYCWQSVRVHIVFIFLLRVVYLCYIAMSPAFVIVIVVVVFVTLTTTATNRQGIDTETILYLQKYGYLRKSKNNTQLSFEEGEIKQEISLFQEYYQISGDGHWITIHCIKCINQDVASRTFCITSIIQVGRNGRKHISHGTSI